MNFSFKKILARLVVHGQASTRLIILAFNS